METVRPKEIVPKTAQTTVPYTGVLLGVGRRKEERVPMLEPEAASPVFIYPELGESGFNRRRICERQIVIFFTVSVRWQR